MGLTTLPCKKNIVEKPSRNSDILWRRPRPSWAVEPRKEEEEEEGIRNTDQYFFFKFCSVLHLKE
jgi:hypothetical protein